MKHSWSTEAGTCLATQSVIESLVLLEHVHRHLPYHLHVFDGVTFMVGAKPGWFVVGSNDPNTSLNGFVVGAVTAVEIDVGASVSIMPGVDLLVPVAEELPGPLVDISFAVKVGS